MLPDALMSTPQQDPPDAVLSHGGARRTAVEITRVFVDGGSDHRRGNANQDWVCREVQRLLPDAGVRPLLVSLGFAHDTLEEAREHVSRAICRIVAAHDPQNEELVDLDWRSDDDHNTRRDEWPPDLEYLSLLRPAQWSVFEVTRGGAGWERTDCRELFQIAIDRKSRALADYRSAFENAWLLIVAEGHDTASFIEPNLETREHLYRAPFDRCFFHRHHFGGWFELRCER